MNLRILVLLQLSFFLSVTTTCRGQELSIKQLTKYRESAIDEVNDLLIAKQWEYVGENYKRYTWAFEKYGERANAWLYIQNDWLTDKRMVEYTFCKSGHIGKLKSELSSLGYKKIESTAEGNYIESTYGNNIYIINIIYKGSEKNSYDDCDRYTIEVRKAKTQAERNAERLEQERMQLLQLKQETECENSRIHRNKRTLTFRKLIDSCNQVADSLAILKNFNLHKVIKNRDENRENYTELEMRIFEENRVQDSIEAAQRVADSLAAMEAALMPVNIEDFNLVGVTKRRLPIYHEPSYHSKVKNFLFKNEKVMLKVEDELFYEIIFDYCVNDSYYTYNGFIPKKYIDLNFVNKNPKK